MDKMNIVWLSANLLGYELLKEALKIKESEIKAVITLSKDSKTIMYDSIENEKWHELGIKVIEVNKVNEEEDIIRELKPDLIIMSGWRQIIDKNILDIPKEGFIGFHPTLLPKGRGPAPIINSILQGFKESGLTMYYVSEGLDDGDIIAQEKFTIEDNDYAQDVYNKVIKAGKKLIREQLPLLIEGKAKRIKQNEEEATIFEKRTLEDNEINLEKENITEIYKKIRALSKPYKGAFIKKNNKKLIIWRADIEEIK
jgi:methionyl-tRNA formyltransferase